MAFIQSTPRKSIMSQDGLEHARLLIHKLDEIAQVISDMDLPDYFALTNNAADIPGHEEIKGFSATLYISVMALRAALNEAIQ